MRITLRVRFAAICIMLVAVSMIAASVVWLFGLKDMNARSQALSLDSISSNAQQNLEYRAMLFANLLADSLINPVYFFDLYLINEQLGPILGEKDVLYVQVLDPDGKVIHNGDPTIPTFGQLLTDPMAEAAATTQTTLIQRSEELLDVSAPLMQGETRVGSVRIGLSLSGVKQEIETAENELRQAYGRTVARQLNALLAVLVPILLAGLGLALLVARAMVRPIKDLVNHTRAIEAGDYQSLPDSGRGDEIGDLLRAFDRMSESVHRNTLEIRHVAYHDSLSGLPNRLMFREFLEQKLAEDRGNSRPISLLFLDMDDFKRVNDTLGHDFGDRLLVDFSERLKACLMDSSIELDVAEEGTNKLVARLGGDEFTVMLIGENSRKVALVLAELILVSVSKPFRIEEQEVVVNVSIGITSYPDDALTADLLVKNADIAMYGAKVAGKNRYQVFDKSMMADTHQRLDLERRLRRAVLNRDFRIHYQPIVRLSDQIVIGAEALVRWNHPERGEMPPSVFIPVAEEIGLIDEIGEFVLEQACRDVARWSCQTEDEIYVSVNLSSRQVRDSHIVAKVVDVLERTGVDAERLSLELTESSLLESEKVASKILESLRALGVRIWLDDFGTGFSGLSHLRRIPIDGVKIDRSFISDILIDPDDLALTSAIISMAESLKMGITAEGVESEGQIDLLKQSGCNQAQGYYFAKPMSHDELLQYLARRTAQSETSLTNRPQLTGSQVPTAVDQGLHPSHNGPS